MTLVLRILHINSGDTLLNVSVAIQHTERQRDKMFYPCMSRLPGWAFYHGYKNLDMEDPKKHISNDVEAIGEVQGLLSPDKKIPKAK